MFWSKCKCLWGCFVQHRIFQDVSNNVFLAAFLIDCWLSCCLLRLALWIWANCPIIMFYVQFVYTASETGSQCRQLDSWPHWGDSLCPLLYFSLCISLSVPISLCLFHSLFLCQRPPDQSVDGCHGYQQPAAAAAAAATRVYFVVSWGEFKSWPFPEPTKPNLTTILCPDLWIQMCKMNIIIELWALSAKTYGDN